MEKLGHFQVQQKQLSLPYNETLFFQKSFNDGFDIFDGPMIAPEGDWCIKMFGSSRQNQPSFLALCKHFLCFSSECWQPFDLLKMYKQEGSGFTYQEYLEYCQPQKLYCKFCEHCRKQQNQKIISIQQTNGQDIKTVFKNTFTYPKGDAIAFKNVFNIGLIQKYRTIINDGNSCLLQFWDEKNHYTLFMYMS